MLEELAGKEGGEDYKTFWEAFGRNIKYGVIEDTENRERLSKLLRFSSSKAEDSLTSLDEYVGRMGANQKTIYYMAADSVAAARAAPFMEAMVAKGIEVGHCATRQCLGWGRCRLPSMYGWPRQWSLFTPVASLRRCVG